jgi:hypothetical protein
MAENRERTDSGLVVVAAVEQSSKRGRGTKYREVIDGDGRDENAFGDGAIDAGQAHRLWKKRMRVDVFERSGSFAQIDEVRI